MKKLILAIIALSLALDISAQYIRINWQHCYTYNYKEQIGTVSAIPSGNGVFILRNRHENYPNGYTKIYLEKTDLNDNVLWSKYFSSSQGAGCFKIVKADENNYYIMGATMHGGCDVTYNPYENTKNVWIIKIDSSGNKLWDKVFGGTGGDYPTDITVTNDGGVAVSVTFAAPYADSLYEGDASKYYGFWDMWIVKLNKDDGHIEWDYTYGSTMREYSSSVIATSDGGCLAGGTSASAPDGNVACYDESGEIITQGVLLKLNAQGEVEWQKCYGSSENDGVAHLLETDDGYIIGAGTCGEDQDLEGAGYHLGYDHLGNRRYDIWIYKIDKQGNLLWSKCFGGSNHEYPCKLFQTTDGEIVVFGVTESINGDVKRVYKPYYEEKIIWMLKLSAQGDLLWQRCIGGLGTQTIEDGVAMLDDNNYIIAANCRFGTEGDLTCGTNYDSTGLDFSWIAHITDTTKGYGLGKHEEEATRYIKVYPNPANDYAIFKYTLPAGTTSAQLQLRDLYGRLVKEETLEGKEGQKLVNTASLPASTYIYTLRTGSKAYNGKLMVGR